MIERTYRRQASVKLNNVDVKATAFALSGNGAAHSTNIEVRNSNLTSFEGAAIYHPQAGIMNVYGGTITGAGDGIEIRGGNVNVIRRNEDHCYGRSYFCRS